MLHTVTIFFYFFSRKGLTWVIIDPYNIVYEKRRNKLVKALREIGLEVPVPKAGLYLWCKIPNEYTSAQFTELLLEKCDVVVTPGTGYGSSGEGFVRLSLTTPDNLVDIGIERISKWNSI